MEKSQKDKSAVMRFLRAFAFGSLSRNDSGGVIGLLSLLFSTDNPQQSSSGFGLKIALVMFFPNINAGAAISAEPACSLLNYS